MLQAKTLADTLTGGRFLLAFYLLWLGLQNDPAAIAPATLALLLAWISDVLDGPLARRDLYRRHTWIGDHDLAADLAVALGTWLYLALAGFVPFVPAVAYAAAASAAVWHFGSVPLAWGVQALPYAAMIWTALRLVPPHGWLLVTWIAVVLLATWPRFPRQILPDFLNGMRALLARRR
jgi:phosphatidylglycerophosphate synthase